MELDRSETLVKAARELMRWTQKRLAEEAGVGVATVRRYETGIKIGDDLIARLVSALEKAGTLFIGNGGRVDDVVVKAGVALKPWAKPDPAPETKRVYPPRDKGKKAPSS